jgi:hypothetical protein
MTTSADSCSGADLKLEETPASAAHQSSAGSQGIALVHYQLEPCLSQANTLHTLHTP